MKKNIGAIVILLLPFFTGSQAAVPSRLEGFIAKLESQKGEWQGGAIAILHKGQVIYKTTFGNKKGNHGPITAKTLFPLASVSKSVSALAIGLMADSGKVSLDETVKLPYFKNPVSLTHIMGHTTGCYFSGNLQIEQGMTRKKLLEMLTKQSSKCKPSRCYLYSNTIFSLVEDVLNVKNLSLSLAIATLKSVLKTNEIQIVPIDPNMDIAFPHMRAKDGSSTKPLPFPPYYPKTVPAAAGIFASLDGMIEVFKLSFGYRPDLISQKTLGRLHKPIIANRNIDNWGMEWPCDVKKIDSYYGIGFRILKAKASPGKDLIFHSGLISGAVAFMGYVPSEEMGIIILMNQSPGMALNIGVKFWGEFLK